MRAILTFTFLLFTFSPVIAGEAKQFDADAAAGAQPWQPSPTGAAVRSLLFPGWGQAYDRKPLKAVIVSGIEQGFIYSVYRQHSLYRYYSSRDQDELAEFYRDQRNRLTWYLTAAVILSMMDAYVDAHLYRFDVSEDLSAGPERGGLFGSGVRLNIFWRP